MGSTISIYTSVHYPNVVATWGKLWIWSAIILNCRPSPQFHFNRCGFGTQFSKIVMSGSTILKSIFLLLLIKIILFLKKIHRTISRQKMNVCSALSTHSREGQIVLMNIQTRTKFGYNLCGLITTRPNQEKKIIKPLL